MTVADDDLVPDNESRAVAFRSAVAVIANSVGDLGKLVRLLERAGGHARLVAALRVRVPPALRVVGAARADPDVGVWAEAAERMIGGGGR